MVAKDNKKIKEKEYGEEVKDVDKKELHDRLAAYEEQMNNQKL
jgi:hypothetical protein